MKRLIQVMGVCAFAAAVMPVASASASFTGACGIHGTASFENPLQKNSFAPNGYKFASKKGEVEVEGKKVETQKGVACVQAGKTNVEEGSATVEGATAGTYAKGQLGCPASAGGWEEKLPVFAAFGNTFEPAYGTLIVEGKEAKFRFRFVGKGTQVTFEVVAGGPPNWAATAAGEASFATDAGGVAKCGSPNGAGPSNLEFTAAAAGTIG